MFAGAAGGQGARLSAGALFFQREGRRCEACQGDGVIKIEMHFLPDVYVTCDICKGRRYDRETLEVKYREKSIADVLDMTVEEAASLFKAVPSIREKMETLARVGLGYVKSASRPRHCRAARRSASNSRRNLSRRSTGRTLYILDEPTTGLHFHDVKKLLEVLHDWWIRAIRSW